ncbi:MAG: low molecular weight phosphotyrosine protein phosphatase [Anaerolineae bacterium]|uniref:low molecular weight protein-tyrosine-phosphatase n=1 Tax=Promineifilum sp. TaxID=2664178 RepID=UPI001DAD527D|nr:low molecular weight phosphotyrosine protein phosphatase [Anaerolineales bacterium]MCB8936537.1 low molecular weight phosphotyrosine protein phosphatase [Promineifilum sp.]MCO5178735.1 low molecular weight phosphotyrosine protein phosphatase [Promineifilum sp.]MCW5846920.1 low molecular weight phosphotyrosine protein phosphatase [Anaerolineae bacterium]
MTVRVLFVCLGNICRSPMAEAVFQKLVDDAGLTHEICVDSAGTSAYHVGEQAHPGTRRVLAGHGIHYEGRARQIRPEDRHNGSTYFVAMDSENREALQERFGDLPHLYRLMDFATHSNVHDIPDPFYSDNFEHVYRLVDDGCRGLFETIRANEGLLR